MLRPYGSIHYGIKGLAYGIPLIPIYASNSAHTDIGGKPVDKP